MARKTKTIVIEGDSSNRDAGKMFVLTEMSPRLAEEWAIKCFISMARSGFVVPPDLVDRGLAGLAVLGLNSLGNVHFDDLKPLLEEMLAQVAFIPDSTKPTIKRGFGGLAPLVDDDIEEIATLLQLRKEMILLHISFFIPANP